jgi:hypothetical protein
VVAAWRSPRLEPDPVGSARRTLLLRLLRGLPPGTGVPTARLGAWAFDRHRLLDPAAVDTVVADLVTLGVVEAGDGGVVGLSAAGRALCDDLDELSEVLAQGTDHFVVQPDHSVIAPPGLRPAVLERLARLADLESEGGASVWRLSAVKIAREAARRDDGEVASFLAAHSSVPVPAAVHRFVEDCASSASPVTVGPAGCVVTSADHLAVAEAARHRAARLTVVAPGVAVSPLPEARVAEILLGRGVLLTARAGAAGAAGEGAPPPPPAPVWMVPHRPAGEHVPPPGPLVLDAGRTACLAERLAGASPGRSRP